MNSDPRIPRAAEPPPAPPVNPNAAKADLRQRLLAARRGLDGATRAQWDRAIGARVVDWWRGGGAAALGVYWPLRDEPDLQAAYAELARLGVRLLLPVVVRRDAALEFAHWNIGEEMVKDKMGVAVPADLRLEAYPPALLVPCLGFNPQGYRLGYGGGFYDRTLARQPRPQTLGVAYSCLAAEFASDRHDIPLDRIVTESPSGVGSSGVSQRGQCRHSDTSSAVGPPASPGPG
ncbi:5-formyltetrahydrofolate cyclo-ligase [Rugamonas violacea]|uniref:5-formyltetrahydrofolate cyclo-ligase n=1 Tax=Rugamonas sp. CCM 8940 TaxID=2765359 RepID=UPI0018F52061|nr:5-formyltetrahydrofolate cyclo-ligase [Rugamonas sp. CCM 8940]